MTQSVLPDDDRSPIDGLETDPAGARWLGRATWGFVALGLTLRVLTYLMNYPLWWDEAFVGVNLLRRGYLDLLRPLDYGQVCPLLFLWAELTSVKLLGFSEWSLRLFPLLCSLFSVVLFRHAASRVLKGPALLFSVAVLAVAVHPIRHAADVKPYASDLLVALILQTLAIHWWLEPRRAGRLWALCGFIPVALATSHPSAFVAGGIGVAIAVPAWRTRLLGVRIAFVAYGLAMFAACVLIYVAFTRPQASSASPGMREMWTRSFPPLGSLVGFIRWIAVAHSGDMMAYPCGGEAGGSSLSLLACVLGSVVFWRKGRSVILACLIAPLGVAMVAAAFRLYPYGGPAPHGSSARIMQYAAPGLCLLIGLGASGMLGWVRTVRVRHRLVRLACLGLVAVGLAPLATGMAHPYRAYQAEAARRFARRFWPEVGRGAEVACLRWDYGVADWDSIQLGIAVMLCDQAIYSPSRRSGGPRWDAVSADRPLRCVLGVAPPSDGPQVVSWLDAMSKDYSLRRSETVRVDLAPPGRPPDLERFEVFEFVPIRPGPQSVSGL